MEILTYCIMSNYFHLLVRIPEYGEVTDQELLRRFSKLHGEKDVRVSMLTAALQEEGPYGKAWRDRLRARMGDVSIFMRKLNDTLKKPTPRSNSLRQGFGQSRATGNLRLFTLWDRVSSYQVFF